MRGVLVVGRQLEECLVRLDGLRDAAGLIGGVAELQLEQRLVVGVRGDDLRVERRGAAERVLHSLIHLVQPLAVDRLELLVDLAAESPPELRFLRGAEEAGPRLGLIFGVHGRVLVAGVIRLAQVHARNRPLDVDVAWAQLEVVLVGGDGLVLVSLVRVGLSELLVPRRVLGVVLDLVARLADRGASGSGAGPLEDVAEARARDVAADAEGDEADAEHECEEDEYPFRLPDQAREEHLLLVGRAFLALGLLRGDLRLGFGPSALLGGACHGPGVAWRWSGASASRGTTAAQIEALQQDQQGHRLQHEGDGVGSWQRDRERDCGHDQVPPVLSQLGRVDDAEPDERQDEDRELEEERDGDEHDRDEREVVAGPDLDVIEVGVVVREELDGLRHEDEVAEREAAGKEDGRDSDEDGHDSLGALLHRGGGKLQSCHSRTGSARANAAYRLTLMEVVNGSVTPSVTSSLSSGRGSRSHLIRRSWKM